MRYIKTIQITIVLPLLLTSLAFAKSTQQAGTRAMPASYGPGTEIFNNPMYRGNAVDKCLYSRGDRQCGKPAADRYCELNGYRESISYDLRERAGNTFLLGSETQCRGSSCDAFRAVACKTRFNNDTRPPAWPPTRPPSKPPGRPPASGSDKFFRSPSFNGFPVDRCLYRGRSCGKPTADAFCKKQGYSYAEGYSIANTRNSWHLQENRSCTNNCQAIVSVQCKAYPNQDGGGQGQAVLYEKPEYRGTPVDECLRQGRDCGSKAAESYCRSKGHPGLISYGSVNSNSRTWLLKDNRYCSGNDCRELRNIRCEGKNNNNNNPAGDFFRAPAYRGRPIARCMTSGKKCGQPVADEFCRLQGYRSASRYQRWYDAGPTIRLGNQKTCDKRSCDALKNIQCSYAPPTGGSDNQREREFLYPAYRGYPISLCLEKGHGCDQIAADEFCRINGYREAINWQQRENIGPTIRLGSKQLCNKSSCDGFWNILCRR